MKNQQVLNRLSNTALPQRQRGANIIAMSLVVLLIAIVANTAIKLMPVYTDYWKYSKILGDFAEEPATADMTRNEMKKALQSRFISNRVEHQTLDDVKIEVKNKSLYIHIFPLKGAAYLARSTVPN